MESFILAISTLVGAIPTSVFVFLSIGLLIFFILVFVIGINGTEWKLKNAWIILTWPIDVINTSGFIIGSIVNSRKEELENLKREKDE